MSSIAMPASPSDANDVDELLRAAVRGDREPLRLLVERRRPVRGEQRRPPRRGCSRSWTTTSIRSPPTCVFSSSAVPRAMIWPWSTTAISSASSSASSRYCVVRSSVLPSRTWLRMTSHMREPAARVEPVVGSSRNRSRGRPMSAAARSSRRRMPPEYVFATRSAASSSANWLEELVRPARRLRARELVEAAEHPEVLAAREVLVDRGVLAGEADQLADGLRRRARRRARRPSPCRRRRGAASRGSGRSSSCRRRSARAGRAPSPRAPRGRPRRARAPRSSASDRP